MKATGKRGRKVVRLKPGDRLVVEVNRKTRVKVTWDNSAKAYIEKGEQAVVAVDGAPPTLS